MSGMNELMPRVELVKPEPGFKLWLRFTDGVTGVVDLSADLWGPAFEELREPGYFAKVQVDSDLGTVAWPNGVDLAPETLYERVRKRPSYA
jgi:hypothetical protein